MRATGVVIAGVTALAASRCTFCAMRSPNGMPRHHHRAQAHDMAVTTKGRVTGTVMTAAMTEAIVTSAANVMSTGAGRVIKATKATAMDAVMAVDMGGMTTN